MPDPKASTFHCHQAPTCIHQPPLQHLACSADGLFSEWVSSCHARSQDFPWILTLEHLTCSEGQSRQPGHRHTVVVVISTGFPPWARTGDGTCSGHGQGESWNQAQVHFPSSLIPFPYRAAQWTHTYFKAQHHRLREAKEVSSCHFFGTDSCLDGIWAYSELKLLL